MASFGLFPANATEKILCSTPPPCDSSIAVSTQQGIQPTKESTSTSTGAVNPFASIRDDQPIEQLINNAIARGDFLDPPGESAWDLLRSNAIATLSNEQKEALTKKFIAQAKACFDSALKVKPEDIDRSYICLEAKNLANPDPEQMANDRRRLADAIDPTAVATARSKICATTGMPAFPWPNPPQPSLVANLSPNLIFKQPGKPATLMDVAGQLEAIIAAAGYLQPKYLGAGCDGFAIMLDLEHIEADGTRKAGAAGYAMPTSPPNSTWSITSRDCSTHHPAIIGRSCSSYRFNG